MYNYNIPQNNRYYPNNFKRYPIRQNDGDRFLGGGFFGPFLLGGATGYLLGRPNYNGPIPVYFPNGVPFNSYPIPYQYSNNYY